MQQFVRADTHHFSDAEIFLLKNSVKLLAHFERLFPGEVCPDDIFRTTEHFVTKRGMVMQHHEPECHEQKKQKKGNFFAIFKVKITARAHMIKI